MGFFDRIKRVFTPEPKEKKRYMEMGNDGFKSIPYSTKTINTIAREKGFISRGQARNLALNNPLAKSAKDVLVDNLVGDGIVPNFIIKNGAKVPADIRSAVQTCMYLSEDDKKAILTGNKTTNDILLAVVNHFWRNYMEKPTVDGLKKTNIYGIQRIAMQSVVVDGEVLILRKFKSKPKLGELPFVLSILEIDYLNDTVPSYENKEVYGGVVIDQDGNPDGYMVYKMHPNDSLRMNRNREYRYISLNDMTHIYRVDRPGQLRGITWYSSIGHRLNDIEIYNTATIETAKISTAFSGFIHNADDDFLEAFTEGTYTFEKEISPGQLVALPPGASIQFSNPPQRIGEDTYVKSLVRSVARGMGIPYSEFSADYSDSNYSSSRLDYLSFNRSLKVYRENIIIPQMLTPMMNWFIEGLEMIGIPTSHIDYVWVMPKRELIDPYKEMQALGEELKLGLVSWSEVCASLGRDPDAVAQQLQSDQELFKSLGIDIDLYQVKDKQIQPNQQDQPAQDTPQDNNI